VSGAPLLIANLGGEETGAWRKLLRQPAPETMAALWSLLFPSGSRIEPVSLQERVPLDPAFRAERAAFGWMDAMVGAVAWYPTRDAEESAGREERALYGPDPEVVGRVHDKAFAEAVARRSGLIPPALRDLALVLDAELLRDAARCVAAIRDALDRWPAWTHGRFVLKPRLSTSGRGRVPGERQAFDEDGLRGAFPRLAEHGGALLEPWLDRVRDLSVQLHLAPGGQLTLLGTVEQVLTPSGLYAGHRGLIDWRGRVGSGSTDHEGALLEAASEMARAATGEGFFGPCGVDAFVFRMGEGGSDREILRPVCEFNARFTTGTVVIGLLRRLLPRLGLAPGDQRPFEFRCAGDLPGAVRAGWEAFPLEPTEAVVAIGPRVRS
jgi:hypothetical protein